MVEEDLASDPMWNGAAQPAKWSCRVGEIPQPRFSLRVGQGHPWWGFEGGVCRHGAMSLPLVERGDKQGRQYLQAGLVFQTGPNGRPRRTRLVLRDLGLVVKTRLGSLLTEDIFGVIPRPGEEVCRSWTYPSAFASPQS